MIDTGISGVLTDNHGRLHLGVQHHMFFSMDGGGFEEVDFVDFSVNYGSNDLALGIGS